MTADRVVPSAILGVAVLIGAAAGCGGDADAGPAPAVEVRDAFSAAGTQALAVYLEVANPGGEDRILGAELLGADADLAQDISLHQTEDRDGLSIMAPTDAIDVPGGTDAAIEPDAAHLMLEGVDEDVAAGRTLQLRLDLERSDDLVVAVRVVGPDEAIGRLSEGGAR